MGGVVSLYAATRFEDVFSGYLAMSTATWFAHEELMAALARHRFSDDTRIYCDIGTCETSNEDLEEFPRVYIDGNKEMSGILATGLDDEHFRFELHEGAIHNEAAWSKRLPSALSWLLGCK